MHASVSSSVIGAGEVVLAAATARPQRTPAKTAFKIPEPRFLAGGAGTAPGAQEPQYICNLMDCSTPGFPVHHQLPEFTQTHVH